MGVTNRLKRDKNSGKVFFPMNVEGGVEDGFFTPLKLITSVIYAIAVLIDFMNLSDKGASSTTWLIHILVLLFIGQLALRYILLNEKYYFKMYKKLMKGKVTTPESLWDVVNIQDYEEGSIIIYSDMKLGAIIKLERDTIIGRDSDFRESHYDAVSDFFKELNIREFSWIKLDIMESAAKDDRLSCLDDIVNGCSNENVSKLVEMHLGYLKSIARNTLYESEYYLIYTKRSNRIDMVLSDINECAYKLLDGAYSRYTVLKSDDIYQLPTELYYVKYFDASRAMLNVFNRTGASNEKTFEIIGLTMSDGREIEVKEKENSIIERLASYKKSGKLIAGKWTITEAFDGKLNNLLNSGAVSNTSGANVKTKESKRETIVAEHGTLDMTLEEDNFDDIEAVANQMRNKASEINKQIISDDVADREKAVADEAQLVEQLESAEAIDIFDDSDIDIVEDGAFEIYDDTSENDSINVSEKEMFKQTNERKEYKSVDSTEKVVTKQSKDMGALLRGRKEKKEAKKNAVADNKREFNIEEIQEDMLNEYNKRDKR